MYLPLRYDLGRTKPCAPGAAHEAKERRDAAGCGARPDATWRRQSDPSTRSGGTSNTCPLSSRRDEQTRPTAAGEVEGKKTLGTGKKPAEPKEAFQRQGHCPPSPRPLPLPGLPPQFVGRGPPRGAGRSSPRGGAPRGASQPFPASLVFPPWKRGALSCQQIARGTLPPSVFSAGGQSRIEKHIRTHARMCKYVL